MLVAMVHYVTGSLVNDQVTCCSILLMMLTWYQWWQTILKSWVSFWNKIMTLYHCNNMMKLEPMELVMDLARQPIQVSAILFIGTSKMCEGSIKSLDCYHLWGHCARCCGSDKACLSKFELYRGHRVWVANQQVQLKKINGTAMPTE